MRVLILNGPVYKHAFDFKKDNSFTIVSSNAATETLVKNHDCVLFTGGSDVDPAMYGEACHESTNSHLERDIEEAKVFDWCINNNIPMIGICRGAQFLTVMSGGKLVQDIHNHAIGYPHPMSYISVTPTKNGTYRRTLSSTTVSSTHHQMMYPWCLSRQEYEIFGYVKDLSGSYEGMPEVEESMKHLGGAIGTNVEPEVIWYPTTRCLCFQYHPETMDKSTEGHVYFNSLVEYKIGRDSNYPIVVGY